MKRWRWHILLFVTAYLVGVVAMLPAPLALRWAEPVLAKLPQRPQLAGVDGTIWSGRAAQATFRGVALGEVEWRLSPWGLLIGRIDVGVKLNGSEGYLDGDLSTGFGGGRVQLRDLQGQVPATLLKKFVPRLPLAPTGSFAITLDEVVIEAAQLRGLDGRIVWNKGGISAPMTLEFGDLVADLTSAEDGITGRIKDSGGPMQLEAELKLTADGTYNLNGKSSARPSAAPALKTSLSLLGQPDAQGMIPFRFNGRL